MPSIAICRAFQLADKSCRLGSPSACTALGLAWVEGWNGTKDAEKAVELFRGAARAMTSAAASSSASRCAMAAAWRPIRPRACDRELGPSP